MLVLVLTGVLSFLSISAVQWLCNANKKSDIPAKRLYCFFSSLYSVLVSMRLSPSLGWPLLPSTGSNGVGSFPGESHSNGTAWGGRTLSWFSCLGLKRELGGLTLPNEMAEDGGA